MRPIISIIVPVYNVEEYLERCVKSLCNQTYRELEIILVDDGSPDACPFLCDAYKEKDNRIKVIHKKNTGVAAARNTGLYNATGKYVSFVDSDDWLELDSIEKLYQIAIKYKVNFVRQRAIRTGWPGLKEHVPCVLEKPREIKGGYYDKDRIEKELYYRLLATPQLTMGALAGAWSSLYDRQFLINNNLFFDENVEFCEDLLFCANVVYALKAFYYIDEPGGYHYCYNPNSVSRTIRKNRWMSCKSLIKSCERDFAKTLDYDFSVQLYCLKWFCIFLALNERRYLVDVKEKEKYCYDLLQDPMIKKMKLQFSKVDISWKQKILMLLVKFRMSKILARV